MRGVTALETDGARVENYRESAQAPEGRQLLYIRSTRREVGFASDGATQWAWLPRAQEYSMTTEVELASSGGHWAFGSPPGVRAELSMLLEAWYDKLDARASGSQVIGTESLKLGDRKVRCYPVELGPALQPGKGADPPPGYTGPSTRRIWIGVDDGLIWKDVERKPLELGSTRVVRVTTTWEVMRVDVALDAGLFRFAPAREMKLVRALNLPPPPTLVRPGAKAPGFSLPLADSGRETSLASLLGKVVLVDFWTTWCPPCQFELPALERIYRDWNSRGLEIVGVSDEKAEIVQKYREEKGHTFPTVVDTRRHAYNAYQVYAIPTVVLIGRNGSIVNILVGGKDEATLREAILAAGL